MARKIRHLEALGGSAPLAGLLEHLGRDALVARLHVGLGRASPLLLLAEDRARRVVAAHLEVELGRLDEAVLIVTDLGGANQLAGLDVVAGGLVEQSVLEADLRRLEGAPALGQGRRLLLGLLRELLLDGSRVLLDRRLLTLILRRRSLAATRQEGGHEQHEPERHQDVAQQRVRECSLRELVEIARNSELRKSRELKGSVQDDVAGHIDDALNEGINGQKLLRQYEGADAEHQQRRCEGQDSSDCLQRRHASPPVSTFGSRFLYRRGALSR